MNYLRCLIFYFIFYLGTTLFFLIFSPVKFFSYKFVVFLSNVWTTYVIKVAKIILGINYSISGIENIPKSGSFIVASNHQSAWETFFFGSLFPGSVFILKHELKRIPIFSQYFKKLGFIFVKRDKAFDSLRKVIKSIKILMNEDKKVFIIFPEGTRIRPDQKTKLIPGVFAIHKFNGLPILPVNLNSGEYWLNKKFLKRRGTIKVEIFPLIKKKKDRNKLIEKLEKYYY